MACWLDTLHDWQDLAAGILAVSAALFVAAVVERRERGRLARRHTAARAVLPLALSLTVEYATACALSLNELVATAEGQRIPRGSTFSSPPLDAAMVAPLRELIEHASPVIGRRVWALLSEVQILGSRQRALLHELGKSTSVVVLANVEEYILNAANIFACGSALFDYARGVTNKAPKPFLSERELITSLNLMGFDISTHPALYATASRRAARMRPTWWRRLLP